MILLYRKPYRHKGQRKTLWLSFVNPRKDSSSHSQMSKKHMCWSLYGLQLYLKETPTQVFSCEILQIFKNTFFTEHLWWLLLEGVCEGTSLVKILQSCHFNIFGMNHRCFRKRPIKKNNELPRLLKRLSFLLLELVSINQAIVEYLTKRRLKTILF